MCIAGMVACDPEDRRGGMLFEQLSPEQCGIRFRNDVKDDSVFNEFTYRNFYNGGGVAIGDLDNDGLSEVFLTANQGNNKLFKNNGHFSFTDVTETSGMLKKGGWSTGVSMADVNGDGLLDIYICTAGMVKNDKRKNELYINKGNLKFEEQAGKYHLQDGGLFHTQASFLDYDLDGDLDVYLLNNSYLVPVSTIGNRVMRTMTSTKGGGHKLMRNDNGVFTDVTSIAGIYGSDIAFGLGVSTSDINNDNWPDLYISNDFFEKDYLYINQKNGSFKEMSDEYLSHMSQSSMGADIADINNDGLMDIFTTDMLPEDDYRLKKNTRFDDFDTYAARFKAGFHHQVLSNMLHVNNGDNTFCEVSQYAGVSATDWSWGALIFDMDNDGLRDIFVSNGMYLDATDQDYVDYTANENQRNLFNNNNKALDYEMLKKMMPSRAVPNYAFINKGNLSFSNESNVLGLGEPGYSNGAAYGDLDNDGDMDMVVNNINSDCFIYRNNASQLLGRKYLSVSFEGPVANRFGTGARVSVYSKERVQTSENFATRGFQSSVEPRLIFGLGKMAKIDSLKVTWPGGAMQTLYDLQVNSSIVLDITKAKDTFQLNNTPVETLYQDVSANTISGNTLHRENDFTDFDRQRLMPRMLSTEGPKLCAGDVNNDGLIDFFAASSRHDTAKLFLQDKHGNFRQSHQPAFAADIEYEDGGAVFFDIDKDGDNDLIVTSAGNLEKEGSELLRVRLYRNNGSGVFTSDDRHFPDIRVNSTVVSNGDYDNDGDDDLFIGGRCVTGEYGISPRSYLLRNDNGVFNDVADTALKYPGMITDAVWEDIDGDKKKELIMIGEWMPLTILKHQNEKFERIGEKQLEYTAGWWNCLAATDIDNDGDTDLIGGNYGLNTRFRADSSKPVELFVNDFDNSGTAEPIVSYYKREGRRYPYYLRGDITAQVPLLKKKYLKYADYAGKTLEEVFSGKLLNESTRKRAYLLSSCIFINDGKGRFKVQELPIAAQLSPVFSIIFSDLTGDGVQDLFLAGNFDGVKPELGRMDANMGTLLKGARNGEFEFMPPSRSGIFYRGEGRCLLLLNTYHKKQMLILSRNNEALKIYRKK